MLFALSLFAELIANDKPYLIWHKGEFFFPAIFEILKQFLAVISQQRQITRMCLFKS